MLSSDRLERVAFRHPHGHIRPPAGKDVVPHDDVVALLGAADLGDDVGLDLLLGEGVDREPDGDRDEGLGVDSAVGIGGATAAAAVF